MNTDPLSLYEIDALLYFLDRLEHNTPPDLRLPIQQVRNTTLGFRQLITDPFSRRVERGLLRLADEVEGELVP